LILKTEQGSTIRLLDPQCIPKELETILMHNIRLDSVALSVGVEADSEQDPGVVVVDIEGDVDQVDTRVLARGENPEALLHGSVVPKKNIRMASRPRNHPMVEAVEVAEAIAIRVEEDIRIQMLNVRGASVRGRLMDDGEGEGLAAEAEEDPMDMNVEDVIQEAHHQIRLLAWVVLI
jgi:hypothetical protein